MPQCPMIHDGSTDERQDMPGSSNVLLEALSFSASMLLKSDKLDVPDGQKELDGTMSVSYNTGESIERSFRWHVLL